MFEELSLSHLPKRPASFAPANQENRSTGPEYILIRTILQYTKVTRIYQNPPNFESFTLNLQWIPTLRSTQLQVQDAQKTLSAALPSRFRLKMRSWEETQSPKPSARAMRSIGGPWGIQHGGRQDPSLPAVGGLGEVSRV